MNLQRKYYNFEETTGNQNAAVGDPMTVKRKGAPKRKKNESKTMRHCKNCKSTGYDARNCAVIHTFSII